MVKRLAAISSWLFATDKLAEMLEAGACCWLVFGFPLRAAKKTKIVVRSRPPP
jgi:hypothetical protein